MQPIVHVCAADVQGKISSFGQIMPPHDLQQLEANADFAASLKRVLASSNPEKVTVVIKTNEESARAFEASISLRLDAESRVIGAAIILIERSSVGGKMVTDQQIRELEEPNRVLTLALGQEKLAVSVQREFLAIMSHEIRTPLNAVVASAELLKTTDLSSTQSDCVRDIEAGSLVMLRVLNDILDYAKLQSDALTLEPVDFSLSDVLSECAHVARVLCEVQGNTFSSSIDEKTPVMVHGDGLRLHQIILNLLNNACKFTKQGQVSLIARRADSSVEAKSATSSGASKRDPVKLRIHVEVADTGIGMSGELLSRIYKPFVQADRSTTRNFEGTGLGLAIVYRLVDLMNGSIEVRSEQGKGEVVIFLLTYNCDGFYRNDGMHGDSSYQAAPESTPTPLPALRAMDLSVLELTDAAPPTAILDLGSSGVKERKPSTQEVAAYLEHIRSSTRVLVVDDSRVNQKIAVKVLEHFGWKSDVCADGLQAVKMVQEFGDRYGIVFMDAHMPVMDGSEALKELRSMEIDLSARRFVAVVTAEALTGAKEKFMALGFDAYVSKPVTLRAIQAVLSSATAALAKWRGAWKGALTARTS
jgi:signal transduction histidine kinase/CheY-like chemotaxis protein